MKVLKLAEQLLDLARELTADHPDFFTAKGPAAGGRATSAFMNDLRRARRRRVWGLTHAEKEICGTNGFRVRLLLPVGGNNCRGGTRLAEVKDRI